MSKVFVITGGTGGLGTALVRRLMENDCRLAGTYLLPDAAQEFESEFEGDEEQLTLTRVDCTNPEAVNAFVNLDDNELFIYQRLYDLIAPDVDTAVDDEFGFHFDMTMRELIAAGMTKEAAEREVDDERRHRG